MAALAELALHPDARCVARKAILRESVVPIIRLAAHKELPTNGTVRSLDNVFKELMRSSGCNNEMWIVTINIKV